MSDFYLTLPSNTKPETNTTSKFSVYLPRKIELHGKWEVALVEIQYPFSWNNLTGTLSSNDATDNCIEVKFPTGHGATIVVPPGYYETIQGVLAAIEYGKHETALELKNEFLNQPKEDLNTVIGTIAEETWLKEASQKNPKFLEIFNRKRRVKNHSQDLVHGFDVSFNDTLKRTKIKKNPLVVRSIRFSPRLQYMLGLHKQEITEKELVGKYIPDLKGGFYALYVYCSLVEPQIVGDSTAPLLRLVNVEGTHGSIAEKIFHTPHYVPVVTKEITKIDIEIKDDYNQLVPFDFGKTILKLHIRKCRSLL